MPLPRPPAVDPLVALADRCVQCGLCLPVCPTYRRGRQEPESPRGRIALARAWALGTVPPTAAGDAHMDACLGCRNCEAACPAGVSFGELLIAARARQRARRPPGLRQRALEALAARPRLLAALIDAYSSVAAALPARWRPMPVAPRGRRSFQASRTGPAAPEDRSRPARASGAPVAIFVGCAARAYERRVRDAAGQLADAAGLSLDIPAGQTCCGALHAHAGDTARARELAATNARAFEGAGTVVTLATGCHEAVAAALTGGTRAVDALELFARHADRLRFRSTPMRVALHQPCTQRNVVGSAPALRALLAGVPDLEVVELGDSGCCGAAGTRMFIDPAQAAAHRAPLLDAAHAAGVTALLSANLGCRLHLAGGTAVPVHHPLEFLADCLDGSIRPRR